MHDERHGSEDSGYFSRRNSKAISTGGDRRDSILLDELGETVEEMEREDRKHDDDRAEEADDEGAGLEDLEEEDEEEEEEGDREGENLNRKDDQDQARKEGIPQPTNQTMTPEHPDQLHPQMGIGTRFISPRKPAEPRVSADEVVAARP